MKGFVVMDKKNKSFKELNNNELNNKLNKESINEINNESINQTNIETDIKSNKENNVSIKSSDIRINKKMRFWNKYKNYIMAATGILVIIFFFVVILKGCGKEKGSENQNTENQTTVSSTSDTTAQSPSKSATDISTQAATKAQVNRVYTTTKTLAKEDFNAASFFENSVFLGDAVVNGIGYYGYIGTNRVISDTNLTTDKAVNYVDQVASVSPQNIFIMVGINDLNYGTRGVDTIVDNYTTLVNQLRTKLPNSKIYILSVLPITQSFESKSNVYIRKANLEALNNKLKTLISISNVNYVDLSPVFQNSAGYLNDNVTNNGVNISNDYYGFLLNTIADMLK